jgi:hypothetical protein
MGLEPTTSSLGSWHSTTELLPLAFVFNDFEKSIFALRTIVPHFNRRSDSQGGHSKVDASRPTRSLAPFIFNTLQNTAERPQA